MNQRRGWFRLAGLGFATTLRQGMLWKIPSSSLIPQYLPVPRRFLPAICNIHASPGRAWLEFAARSQITLRAPIRIFGWCQEWRLPQDSGWFPRRKIGFSDHGTWIPPAHQERRANHEVGKLCRLVARRRNTFG